SVALAARKLADVLLLVLALEVEGADVSARAHVVAVDLHVVEPVRDFLPDVLRRVEMIAALVDITEMHRLADFDRAAVGLLLPGDDLEQRRFAGAVRPDHADDAARGQHE